MKQALKYLIIYNIIMNQKLTAEWCEGDHDEGTSIFARNGLCSCGMFHHHYHCGNCGKVTQVG